MLKKFLVPMALLISCSFLFATPTAKAGDFIELDLTGVAPAARASFIRAERIWESRITGYSNNLPNIMKAQLTNKLTISAQTTFIDGVGGILGAAGPDTLAQHFENIGDRNNPFLVRQYAIPTSSSMFFDSADAGRDDFDAVVLHEMGHAIGIGSVWELNGIIDPTVAPDANIHRGLLSLRNGTFQYTGEHGLRGFREQSGHFRANYVPTENDFGPGTALSHWESDNWFFNPRFGNRSELMIGFSTGKPTFISEASWGSLADIGYAVEGFTDGFLPDEPGRPFFPKRGFGPQFNQLAAVPEPSSVALISLALSGLLVRRRRAA